MGHVVLPVQSMHELCFFRCASEFARTELDVERQVYMFLGSSWLLGAVKGGGKLLTLRQCYMCIWEA